MSTIKVDGIRSNSASSDAITLDGNGKCAVTGTTITADTGKFSNLPNRNLIINGAMQVAQRGTSSTSTSSVKTIDRYIVFHQGANESPTQSQEDVASGTTPYTLGFRKCFRITNGNQSNADAGDYVWIRYKVESQDLAKCGWNYTSTSSFATLSFWVKSSVAQDFKGYLRTNDGTKQNYAFSTGALSANTWTKITKVLPGASGIQFDNDNGTGLEINIAPFFGTNYSDAGTTEHVWTTYVSGERTAPSTDTWWLTDDATFEMTGLQLEVGDSATDFEHRSYGHELYLCQRYFELVKWKYYFVTGYYQGNGNPVVPLSWNVEKRATPTVTLPTVGTGLNQIQVTNSGGSWDTSSTNIAANHISTLFARIEGSGYGGSASTVCSLYINGTDGSVQINAEL